MFESTTKTSLLESIPLKTCDEVITKFIAPWRRRKNVLGILLTGSYATGLATPQSDIDILIVVRDIVRYWQRGNVTISSFLVEYLVYPISHLIYLQEKDLIEGKRLRTRMLAKGGLTPIY